MTIDVVDVAAHGIMGALVSTVFFETFRPSRQTSVIVIVILAAIVFWDRGRA